MLEFFFLNIYPAFIIPEFPKSVFLLPPFGLSNYALFVSSNLGVVFSSISLKIFLFPLSVSLSSSRRCCLGHIFSFICLRIFRSFWCKVPSRFFSHFFCCWICTYNITLLSLFPVGAGSLTYSPGGYHSKVLLQWVQADLIFWWFNTHDFIQKAEPYQNMKA